jgi:hypothetical protein
MCKNAQNALESKVGSNFNGWLAVKPVRFGVAVLSHATIHNGFQLDSISMDDFRAQNAGYSEAQLPIINTGSDRKLLTDNSHPEKTASGFALDRVNLPFWLGVFRVFDSPHRLNPWRAKVFQVLHLSRLRSCSLAPYLCPLFDHTEHSIERPLKRFARNAANKRLLPAFSSGRNIRSSISLARESQKHRLFLSQIGHAIRL